MALAWKAWTMAWRTWELAGKALAPAWIRWAPDGKALAWKELADYWVYFRQLLCLRRRLSGVQQESVQQSNCESPCGEFVSSSDPLFSFIFWSSAPTSKRQPAVRTMKRKPSA
jgi:hypothetical protein